MRENNRLVAATIQAEEDVCLYGDASNGAGPMWCFGSTCLARVGRSVFASAIEVIPDAKPLNNVRWSLRRRDDDAAGWRLMHRDMDGRTREPSPIGAFDDAVMLTANPTLAAIDAYSGPAEPRVCFFDPAKAEQTPRVETPDWGGKPAFTEHSYRSFAADPDARTALYMNNIGYHLAHWSLRDVDGKWSRAGELRWPMGDHASPPQPVRLCYPSVLLRKNAVHFLGIGDIEEPNRELREYKFSLTKNKWDYIFCKLCFASTPDIGKAEFTPWLTVSDREATRGTMLTCDSHLDASGTTHLLWYEESVDPRLRDKFFPGVKITRAVRYARVSDGRVTLNKAVLESGESTPGPRPDWGRFHVAPDGSLMIVLSVWQNAGGQSMAENQILTVDADGGFGAPVRLNLQHPFARMFFTATPRAGTRPSKFLDLYGVANGRPNVMRYARVEIG